MKRCRCLCWHSYVRQLLEVRPEAASTTALTQFIVRNAVSLAERCVTVASPVDTATAGKQTRKKSKKSHGIVDKFLNQVDFSIFVYKCFKLSYFHTFFKNKNTLKNEKKTSKTRFYRKKYINKKYFRL